MHVVVKSSVRLQCFAITLCAVALSLDSLIRPAPALAQGADYRASDKAPPSWEKFSKLVKYRFETWVAADEPVANRFRAYVIDNAGKDGGPPPTLVVRAWLNPDGTVERISFSPLPDTHADADLRTILKRGNIGEAPPPEMLQPVNLRFSLNLRK